MNFGIGISDFGSRVSDLALLSALTLASASCVGPPRSTEAAKALELNSSAVVEGRVTDTSGRPVAGLRVEGIPRGKDIEWSAPALTDSEGRFELRLFAPAAYGFVLREGETTVVTDDPRDPSRVHVAVAPGERRGGIELLFLREKWTEILRSFHRPSAASTASRVNR